MAAFREKRGAAEQNEHFCIALEELQPHFRELPCSRGPSPGLQFISPKMRYSITARDKLAKQCNLRLATIAIDNFIKIGGDDPMG